MSELTISPIAHIRTPFKDKFGLPRQSGRVSSLTGAIVFEPQFRNPDAIRGLDGFSHIWLIFEFSQSHRENFSPTVRPPRLGGNRRVGVFASRSPFRPNSLGLSCVKLKEIRHDANLGDVLEVEGIDLLDGTPIFDLKPYLPHADCIPDALGGFADEFASYKLEVVCPDSLAELLPDNIRDAVFSCLAEDPRPSYQNDPERIYTMSFDKYEIDFTSDEKAVCIKNVRESINE